MNKMDFIKEKNHQDLDQEKIENIVMLVIQMIN
jgi:hypothetical protein